MISQIKINIQHSPLPDDKESPWVMDVQIIGKDEKRVPTYYHQEAAYQGPTQEAVLMAIPKVIEGMTNKND